MIIQQPALAPSPQPRPAPTARALPPEPVAQGGQNWTPIGGQIWKPIDSKGVDQEVASALRTGEDRDALACPDLHPLSSGCGPLMAGERGRLLYRELRL